MTATSIIPANYPPMDKVPPTDSAEVQQWIAEVAASGIDIPNLTATLPGGCPANLAAAQGSLTFLLAEISCLNFFSSS